MFNFPNLQDRALTIQNILKLTTEAEIFRHFLGYDYKLKKFYKSPLRTADKRPSFNVYCVSGSLRYKDFGHSEGSCFDFVKHLRNTDFSGALSTISQEMNLNLREKKVTYKDYSDLHLQDLKRFTRGRAREWQEYDKNYWQQYHISSETLAFFDIYPGQEVWTRREGEAWKRIWVNQPDNPIYLYKIEEYEILPEGIVFSNPGIKAYRPFQTEEYSRDPTWKWFTGISGNYMQGLKQLPMSGRLLFITSSLKDVATLYQVGIPAIAPNAENSHISNELIEVLKSRFNNIYVNYDSDDTGVRASQQFTVEHGLLYWNVPKIYEAKDVSDLVNKTSQETLINELKKKNVL